MSGKISCLSRLTSRKQLLIAESELNRALLVAECQTLADEVQGFASQAETVSSLVSSTVSLMTGLVSLGGKKPATGGETTSWWQTAIKGAGLIGSCWSAYRSRNLK